MSSDVIYVRKAYLLPGNRVGLEGHSVKCMLALKKKSLHK